MDPTQFDRLTRAISHAASRRGVLGGVAAALTGFVATASGSEGRAAAPHSVPLGGACYRDRQCHNDYVPTRHRHLNPDLQIVHCAENGFTYDGQFNCCRYSGGACYVDEDCCSTRVCVKQLCKYVRSRRRIRHPRTGRRRRR